MRKDYLKDSQPKFYSISTELISWWIGGILLLVIAILFSVIQDLPVSLKVFFIFISTTYAIGLIINHYRLKAIYKSNYEENNRILLEDLKNKYSSYISLVDDEITLLLARLKNDEKIFLGDFVSTADDYDYLLTFSKLKNKIHHNKIIDSPDSFILAACLLYALVSKPKLVIDLKQSNFSFDFTESELKLNLKLAINCAIRIISEPSALYCYSGRKIEKKYPAAQVLIPTGIFETDHLDSRIEETLLRDFLLGNPPSVMQISNMLFLIYLYCVK